MAGVTSGTGEKGLLRRLAPAYAHSVVDYKMTAPFIEIGTVEHIAVGEVITIAMPTGTVAVFNVGGRIFAIDDGCVRCGASLAEGSLTDMTVTCPNCDWRYDIESGSVQGIPSLRTDIYEVKVIGRRIMVAPRKD